ncbi:MAG: histidine triad nucleotide-binding protein [Desulfuromonadales bacterium]|nr:MAG: histidine triad nucleotide-binding protein [Desulfuromonadales bacterium]
MDNCIFCKIIEGTIPAKKVYEDEEIVAIEDIKPEAPHHLLLIPKKHIVNALDLTPADDALVGRVYRVAASLARERGVDERGFRIVQNTNADAGQSVFHIHFHFLAGRHMAWPPG